VTKCQKSKYWPWNWPPIKIYKPLTRGLIFFSLLTGFGVLAVCWIIDLRDDKWWHAHSYIPNIWAGITGFLIGAPVALVVLATFTNERERNSTLERVNDMSDLAWKNLLTAFRNFCTAERLAAVSTGADEVNSEHNKAFNALYTLGYIIWQAPDFESIGRTTTEVYREIQERAEHFRLAVDPVTAALGESESIEIQWAALVGAWQTLDQFIRLQRLEQRLDWFFPEEPSIDAEIKKWLAQSPNKLTEFADLHGYSANTPFSASTMVNAANTVRIYSDNGEEELRRRLMERNDKYFGYASVVHYITRAHAARSLLQRLDECITRIQKADWPASSSKPREEEVKHIKLANRRKRQKRIAKRILCGISDGQ
jgi:hypothetical protein